MLNVRSLARPDLTIVTRLLPAILALSIPTTGLFAQDTKSSAKEEVDEIIVIGAKRKFAPSDSSAATKIRMDVFDTPQSLTIVSRELMNISGADSYGDVASLAPNTLDNDRDLSMFFDAVARGFHVDFRQGYKVNSVPIINEGFVIDFDLVERAELVRGPSSILYGQSDYGSTLNLQLKKPQAQQQTIAEVTLGAHQKYKLLVDTTGALSDSERLRGRLILAHEDTEHAQDIASRETTTVAPSLSYDIDDDTTIDVTAFHSERTVKESWGVALTDTFELLPVDKERYFSTDWGRSIQRTTYVQANLLHEFNEDLNLSVAGAYSDSAYDWREPYVWGLASASGDVDFWDYNAERELKIWTANTTLSGSFDAFGGKHEFMLDAFYRQNRDDNPCCYFGYLGTINLLSHEPTGFPMPPAVGLPVNSQDEKDLGFGGLLLLHPSDRLTIMAGARWTRYENTPRGAGGWFGLTDKYADDTVLPRFGIVYQISENMNLFASYSEGLLFRRAATATGGHLDPEQGKQWEAGIKAKLFDERLNMALAYFTIDRDNVAASDPDFPGQPFNIGIDGQKHEGVEFEAIGEPIPGWNIFLSYGYTDVTVTDAPFPGMIGQQRANTPRHQIKLYTTYEVLEGALQGLSIGGGIVDVGKREIDNFGTYQLPAYTRVDLRLAYDALENVSFSLNFLNLTDEDILASYDESYFSGILFQDYRTVIGKVTMRF